jgi:hypothetical protein
VKQQRLESGISKQDAVLGAELALERRSPAGLRASGGQNQRQRVIDSLCRALLGVHARINQGKDENTWWAAQWKKRKSQILNKHKIRCKTDLSIEINWDSYNHGGHHPPSLIWLLEWK